MWRSSTTTIGSAAAIFHLRPPEEKEPEYQREYRPAYGVVPEVMRVGVVVTVRAVQQGLRRRLGTVAHGRPDVALLCVVGLRAGGALPLGLQQRVPDQRDVQRRRVELQHLDDPAVRLDAERGDVEQHPGYVQPGAQQERQQLAEVVDLRAESRD